MFEVIWKCFKILENTGKYWKIVDNTWNPENKLKIVEYALEYTK